ncbi:MAG: hypothetical protein AMJ43_00470 [Coxiella sp. DG_40]|nr:MAG: hypothetical protein AMJ43_00470 [Coxiella sp. DG_40]
MYQAEGAALLQYLPVFLALAALEVLGVEYDAAGQAILGVTAHVGVEFASFGLGADAQILDGATDDSHSVALEVGEGDEHIGRGDCLGDVRFLENITLREVHPVIIRAHEAIGADEWTTQGGRIVPIAFRGDHYVQAGASAGIHEIWESGGVTHEGPAAESFYPVSYGAGVNGAQVSGVIPFAAVELDSNYVPRGYLGRHARLG